MRQAFNGIIYDTDKATLIARDPPDPFRRVRYLYRTPQGAFFLYRATEWSHFEDDPKITPLTQREAIDEYNHLEERYLDFLEAFPDTDFTEA